MSSRKVTRSIIAGAAVLVIGGSSYGIVSAVAGGSSATASGGSAASAGGSAAAGSGLGSGSNARSGPAAGGTSGTVASVSASGFTVTTSAGQKVTISESAGTKYLDGTTSAAASDVAVGSTVLVLGTTDNTTIAATQVTLHPASGAATPEAAGVVPFQRGAPTTSKQVGQVPADYTEGQGTIVSGTAANRATEAALAAYPGGIVDRVVQLGNGEYEVHYIGVNWPHHVFVSRDFTVIGAG
jgi:Domain of unknown function (DUF5666)